MAKAKNALKPQASFEENFITLIRTAFTYIYEKILISSTTLRSTK